VRSGVSICVTPMQFGIGMSRAPRLVLLERLVRFNGTCSQTGGSRARLTIIATLSKLPTRVCPHASDRSPFHAQNHVLRIILKSPPLRLVGSWRWRICEFARILHLKDLPPHPFPAHQFGQGFSLCHQFENFHPAGHVC